jgi:hypothetical protein
MIKECKHKLLENKPNSVDVPFWRRSSRLPLKYIRHLGGSGQTHRVNFGPHQECPEMWPFWLGEEPADTARPKALLAPYPTEGMIAWPVSPRVGNVKNNDPGLIEPITGAVQAR